MNETLRHRGPDNDGIVCFDNCILGHTRLSIVDLKTGQQPMTSNDGHTAVTFNGEIYGYKTIKSSLDNYPFKTDSDTEVILALYQEHGTGCTSKIPGMFSFSLWDDKLFCTPP